MALKSGFCFFFQFLIHRLIEFSWKVQCSVYLRVPNKNLWSEKRFLRYLKPVFFLDFCFYIYGVFLKHVIEISQSSIMHNKKDGHIYIFYFITHDAEFHSFSVLNFSLSKKSFWAGFIILNAFEMSEHTKTHHWR